MRIQSSLVAIIVLCLPIATALPHANVTTPKSHGRKGSGILSLGIRHRKGARGHTKRQDHQVILNEATFYEVQITIGTPPQPVWVDLDTGSSELWVDPVCANAYNPAYCNTVPRYDPSQSSTAVDQDATFEIQYGTGDVDGEYYKDTVGVGGVSITTQRFGVADTSSFLVMGLLGVGLGYGFGYEGIDEYYDYYNVIDRLFVEGFTQSRAFGLNLGSSTLASGTIDFGGIDTGKYIGALYKSPMIPYDESPDGFPRYWFYLTSAGVTQPGSSSSTIVSENGYEQPMFPDCGATLSQLPPSLFNALIQFFPTAVNDGSGIYEIDCSIRDQPGTLDFGFGTKVVSVPFSEWFRPSGSTCIFGAVSNENTYSFGDTFMRSAYIVYDQDNFNIHIAQGANCGTNVIPITSGDDAVPSVTGQCVAASSTSSHSSTKTSSSTKSSSSIKKSSSSSSTKISTTSSSHSITQTTSSSVKPTANSTKVSSSTKVGTTSKTTSSSTKSTSTSKSSTSSLKPTSTTSNTKSSSKSSSQSLTTNLSSTKTTVGKGPTTTFLSTYTSSHHRVVTTIVQK